MPCHTNIFRCPRFRCKHNKWSLNYEACLQRIFADDDHRRDIPLPVFAVIVVELMPQVPVSFQRCTKISYHAGRYHQACVARYCRNLGEVDLTKMHDETTYKYGDCAAICGKWTVDDTARLIAAYGALKTAIASEGCSHQLIYRGV